MLLRKDDPWVEKLPISDIRNWRVFDREGSMVGFVETVVVDRSSNTFEALLIGANDRFAAGEVEIGEGVVRLNRDVTRRKAVNENYDALPTDFEKAYREHFRNSYDNEAWTFDDLLPAYHFGREMAYDADFAALTFASAEDDLKGRYTSRRLRPHFGAAREAVRCAYTLAHRGHPSAQGGLDRDERQIMSASKGTGGASDAGAAMSNVALKED